VEQSAHDALASCGERVHAYTHLSHVYPQGASVYTTFVYRLTGDYQADLARWQTLKAAACDAVVGGGGTISHQHGVGVDHAPYLEAEKGTLGLSAIRELCRHFDPIGMMNPGKLVSAA
jgi:alkyldihydroxyacetonephosphate synthase